MFLHPQDDTTFSWFIKDTESPNTILAQPVVTMNRFNGYWTYVERRCYDRTYACNQLTVTSTAGRGFHNDKAQGNYESYYRISVDYNEVHFCGGGCPSWTESSQTVDLLDCPATPTPGPALPGPIVPYSYTFPPTQTTEFIHALCVMGASSASAASTNNPDLTYSMLSGPFEDHVMLWSNKDWKISDIGGKGLEGCEGGTFLRPSLWKVCESIGTQYLFNLYCLLFLNSKTVHSPSFISIKMT